MPYDDAIRACQENEALLIADVKAGDLQAHALWNLSVAIRDLAESLRDDMHDLQASAEVVRAAVEQLQARKP